MLCKNKISEFGGKYFWFDPSGWDHADCISLSLHGGVWCTLINHSRHRRMRGWITIRTLLAPTSPDWSFGTNHVLSSAMVYLKLGLIFTDFHQLQGKLCAFLGSWTPQLFLCFLLQEYDRTWGTQYQPRWSKPTIVYLSYWTQPKTGQNVKNKYLKSRKSKKQAGWGLKSKLE